MRYLCLAPLVLLAACNNEPRPYGTAAEDGAQMNSPGAEPILPSDNIGNDAVPAEAQLNELQQHSDQVANSPEAVTGR